LILWLSSEARRPSFVVLVRKEGASHEVAGGTAAMPMIKPSIRIRFMHLSTQKMALGHPEIRGTITTIFLFSRSGRGHSGGAAGMVYDTLA